MSHAGSLIIWAISAATVSAIAWRPFRISEWIWSVAGAATLVATGTLSGHNAAIAAADGLDVYLFLAGMLTLAELARVHGVFDWLAGKVLTACAGDAGRLFTWVYVSGIVVTALLSNDATIVLLTPAVLALTARAQLRRAPYVYACAFISNAASFVLPVSNPANLVVFRQLPKLAPWLASFALPSLAAIAATFVVLRVLFRRDLATPAAYAAQTPPLATAGRLAAGTVAASAAAIVTSSGLGLAVGQVAFVCAVLSVLMVSTLDARTPKLVGREAPWSIVPLVAGLFVIVRALDETGVLQAARSFFRNAGVMPNPSGHLLVGGTVMLADNVLNNLPVGVLARYSLHDNGIAVHVMNAALIGVDLGPNLSLTGSLATLLWVLMLRRERVGVSPWRFLRIGVLVTLPALVLSLLCVR